MVEPKLQRDEENLQDRMSFFENSQEGTSNMALEQQSESQIL